MRTLIIAVVVMVPVVASADIIGRVGLYTDQAGTNCMVDNSAPGLDEVYIVVDGLASGIISILFAAPVPECWTGATWLADVWPWELIIGDTQLNDPRGIAITGINCQVPTQYIGKMLINTQGVAQPCCGYPVVKSPADNYTEYPMPTAILCEDPTTVHYIPPAFAVINGDASCFCHLAVPVETTTWGQVKSLYE